MTCLGKGLGVDLGLGEILLLQSSPECRRLLANDANKQNK